MAAFTIVFYGKTEKEHFGRFGSILDFWIASTPRVMVNEATKDNYDTKDVVVPEKDRCGGDPKPKIEDRSRIVETVVHPSRSGAT